MDRRLNWTWKAHEMHSYNILKTRCRHVVWRTNVACSVTPPLITLLLGGWDLMLAMSVN